MARQLTRIPRYQLTPYQHWYRETWPNHVLADPEAQRKEKRLFEAVTGVVGAISAVAIIASLISKTPGARGFGDIFAGFVDSESTNSASDTSPASDTCTDTAADTIRNRQAEPQ